MEKLNKEDVYINLQGKSEEELTELYNFLISVGEDLYIGSSDLLNNNYWVRLEFWKRTWLLSNSKEHKQEVTIQQLKEILQQEINNIEVDFEKVEVNYKSIFGITPDKVVQLVMNDLNERSKVGVSKYGVTLEREDVNLLGWLKHLREELMDASLYIKRAEIEIEKRNDRNI